MAHKRSTGTRTAVKDIPAKSSTETSISADAAAHRWTFLTNHSHVLIVLANDPSLVLREVAVRVGITERAVQRIIAELEEDGFVEKERVGRRNHYRIHADRALRHPIEEHRTIGDILDLICN